MTLAVTDFKLRNEGTWFGVLWYLLDPIVMFVTIILVRKAIIATEPEFYPVYLFVGLIVFNFFRRATTQSIRSISGSGQFIKSMTIPKAPLVAGKVIDALFTHVFEIVLLAIILIYYHIPVWHILFYIPIVIVYTVFILGVSFLLATIGVKIFDLQNLWPIAMQILWFATPIFYSLQNVSEVVSSNVSSVQNMNPLYQFIHSAREAIMFASVDLYNVLYICAVAIISILIGLFIFSRYKNRFAEYM